MRLHRTVIILALLVAIVGTTSLALPAAEAEKERRKCAAKGTLPCAPTVTLTFIHAPFAKEGFCIAVVSVTGFAPDSYPVLITGSILYSLLDVGPDGKGSVSSQTPSDTSVFTGPGHVATVNGIQSAAQDANCPQQALGSPTTR